MKNKLLSFIFAIFMIVPCCLALTACGNEPKDTCTFETVWTANETEHWHACKDKNCTKVKDKANHIWNDGVIVTEATESANGTKKFTCTVCQYEKTESYIWVRNTVKDAEEWNKAVTFDGIDKLDLTVNTDESFGELVVDGTKIHVIEKEKDGETFVSSDEEYYDKVVSAESTTYNFYYKDRDGEWQKTNVVSSGYENALMQTEIFGMFQNKFEDFKYDTQTKEYKLTQYVLNISGETIIFKNVVFKFENGKLVYYSWTVEYISANDSKTMAQNGEISYENISVTLPARDLRKVNENVFKSAVLLEFSDVKNNYEHTMDITRQGLTTNEKIVFENGNFYYYENEELAVGGHFVTEIYYEKEDVEGTDEYYKYTKSDDVWTKTQFTDEDFGTYHRLSPDFRYSCYELFAFSYDQFEFDEESGKYVSHNFEQKLMIFPTVELTFLDGRLKEAYWTTSDGETYHATLIYNSSSVVLPIVD